MGTTLQARPMAIELMILPAINCPYRWLPTAEVISTMHPMIEMSAMM